jgi:nicotinamide-nucleotide amidase
VSVAESCTAGALGYLLTETPGSSEVFRQGYLTYSNAAKTSLLGVDAETLKAHGAVSEPTALAMARGCLQASGANFGVAVTGIAGPDGGNAEKPVGLVYVAVASARRAEAYRFQFRGNRKNVRWRSAYTALNCLRLFIDKELR